MMRRLLTPRWMAFTALMLTAAVVAVWLAWWQLERYEDVGGSFQNLGYTLQWPVFGVFVVYLWWRLLRDAVAKPDRATEGEDVAERSAAAEEPAAEERQVPAARAAASVPVPVSVSADADDDPELAAYNRYLAGLAERNQR